MGVRNRTPRPAGEWGLPVGVRGIVRQTSMFFKKSSFVQETDVTTENMFSVQVAMAAPFSTTESDAVFTPVLGQSIGSHLRLDIWISGTSGTYSFGPLEVSKVVFCVGDGCRIVRNTHRATVLQGSGACGTLSVTKLTSWIQGSAFQIHWSMAEFKAGQPITGSGFGRSGGDQLQV